uniref:Nudix (nucleoside diphosphate linked moiety X)-type motif 18 n=1 Tax=Kryptolebias marmoratus TaxID=37003 RepID=A0A3Q3AFP5_KRYMA
MFSSLTSGSLWVLVGLCGSLWRLLSGQGSEVGICDVGLELSKPATLRKNVTYIVCVCLLQEEVLMVQEAKQDCYKQWYLPAGRVEVGESLEEAMKREVKEEAGFDCEPITLLLIQEQGPQWVRFIFLAKVTGQRSQRGGLGWSLSFGC